MTDPTPQPDPAVVLAETLAQHSSCDFEKRGGIRTWHCLCGEPLPNEPWTSVKPIWAKHVATVQAAALAARTADAAARLAAVEALAAHLVDAVLWGRCEVTADPGTESKRHDPFPGRCPRDAEAYRWEDGFGDMVCEPHAENARQRGALVVAPRRADGTVPTLSATAPDAGQRGAQERAEVHFDAELLERLAQTLYENEPHGINPDEVPWSEACEKTGMYAEADYWRERARHITAMVALARADRSPEQP